MRDRLNSLLRLLQHEAVFRWGLIAAISVIITLHLVGPEWELNWPVVGLMSLILVIYYFPTISHIVLPGNIELHREIDRAQDTVNQSVEAHERAALDEAPEIEEGEQRDLSALTQSDIQILDVKEVLQDSFKRSSQGAAMELGRLLEQAVADLTVLYVPQSEQRLGPMPERIRRLLEQELIDATTASATNEIWQLRNRAVHGHAVSDDEIVRILDLGVRVLQFLRDAARRNWQVSAPRSALPQGEAVDLGLRKKFGTDTDHFIFTCEVTDPQGGTATASSHLLSDIWSFVAYPSDFSDASTNPVGEYSVRYFISDVLVATDKFVVWYLVSQVSEED